MQTNNLLSEKDKEQIDKRISSKDDEYCTLALLDLVSMLDNNYSLDEIKKSFSSPALAIRTLIDAETIIGHHIFNGEH